METSQRLLNHREDDTQYLGEDRSLQMVNNNESSFANYNNYANQSNTFLDHPIPHINDLANSKMSTYQHNQKSLLNRPEDFELEGDVPNDSSPMANKVSDYNDMAYQLTYIEPAIEGRQQNTKVVFNAKGSAATSIQVSQAIPITFKSQDRIFSQEVQQQLRNSSQILQPSNTDRYNTNNAITEVPTPNKARLMTSNQYMPYKTGPAQRPKLHTLSGEHQPPKRGLDEEGLKVKNELRQMLSIASPSQEPGRSRGEKKQILSTNLSVIGQQAGQLLARGSLSASRESRITDKTQSYSQILKMMRNIEEYGKNIELQQSLQDHFKQQQQLGGGTLKMVPVPGIRDTAAGSGRENFDLGQFSERGEPSESPQTIWIDRNQIFLNPQRFFSKTGEKFHSLTEADIAKYNQAMLQEIERDLSMLQWDQVQPPLLWPYTNVEAAVSPDHFEGLRATKIQQINQSLGAFNKLLGKAPPRKSGHKNCEGCQQMQFNQSNQILNQYQRKLYRMSLEEQKKKYIENLKRLYDIVQAKKAQLGTVTEQVRNFGAQASMNLDSAGKLTEAPSSGLPQRQVKEVFVRPDIYGKRTDNRGQRRTVASPQGENQRITQLLNNDLEAVVTDINRTKRQSRTYARPTSGTPVSFSKQITPLHLQKMLNFKIVGGKVYEPVQPKEHQFDEVESAEALRAKKLRSLSRSLSSHAERNEHGSIQPRVQLGARILAAAVAASSQQSQHLPSTQMVRRSEGRQQERVVYLNSPAKNGNPLPVASVVDRISPAMALKSRTVNSSFNEIEGFQNVRIDDVKVYRSNEFKQGDYEQQQAQINHANNAVLKIINQQSSEDFGGSAAGDLPQPHLTNQTLGANVSVAKKTTLDPLNKDSSQKWTAESQILHPAGMQHKASLDHGHDSQTCYQPLLEPAREAAGWEEVDQEGSADKVAQPQKKLQFSSFGSVKPTTRGASGQPTLCSSHPYQPDKMLSSFDRRRRLKAAKKRRTQGSSQARVHTQNQDTAAERDEFGPPPEMDAIDLKNYFDLFTNSFGTKNPQGWLSLIPTSETSKAHHPSHRSILLDTISAHNLLRRNLSKKGKAPAPKISLGIKGVSAASKMRQAKQRNAERTSQPAQCSTKMQLRVGGASNDTFGAVQEGDRMILTKKASVLTQEGHFSHKRIHIEGGGINSEPQEGSRELQLTMPVCHEDAQQVGLGHQNAKYDQRQLLTENLLTPPRDQTAPFSGKQQFSGTADVVSLQQEYTQHVPSHYMTNTLSNLKNDVSQRSSPLPKPVRADSASKSSIRRQISLNKKERDPDEVDIDDNDMLEEEVNTFVREPLNLGGSQIHPKKSPSSLQTFSPKHQHHFSNPTNTLPLKSDVPIQSALVSSPTSPAGLPITSKPVVRAERPEDYLQARNLKFVKKDRKSEASIRAEGGTVPTAQSAQDRTRILSADQGRRITVQEEFSGTNISAKGQQVIENPTQSPLDSHKLAAQIQHQSSSLLNRVQNPNQIQTPLSLFENKYINSPHQQLSIDFNRGLDPSKLKQQPGSAAAGQTRAEMNLMSFYQQAASPQVFATQHPQIRHPRSVKQPGKNGSAQPSQAKQLLRFYKQQQKQQRVQMGRTLQRSRMPQYHDGLQITIRPTGESRNLQTMNKLARLNIASREIEMEESGGCPDYVPKKSRFLARNQKPSLMRKQVQGPIQSAPQKSIQPIDGKGSPELHTLQGHHEGGKVELAGATLKIIKSGSTAWESIPDTGGNGRNLKIVAQRGSYLGSGAKHTKLSSTHGRTASVQQSSYKSQQREVVQQRRIAHREQIEFVQSLSELKEIGSD